MRPTRRCLIVAGSGIVLAVLPAIGLTGLWPVLPVFWALIAAVFAVDALMSPRRKDLVWDVEIPDALHVGARDLARLRAALPTRRSLPARAVLDLSDDLEPPPAAAGTVSADEREFVWNLVPTLRGTATVEAFWFRYLSPLRLWSWTVRQDLGTDMPVLPNLPMVKSTAIRFFSDREFRAGLKIERYQGDGTEFDSLKEYLHGDDHRAIDWKSSARHRRLHCRQFRAERNHQVVLALDTGHLMCERLDGIPKLDHAINAALLLAYVCLRSGDRVGLFTFDAKVGSGLDPQGGLGAMKALIHATSGFRYSTDETNFTLGLTSLSQRLRRRSLVILLTDFVDTVTSELLLENLDRFGRRHLVVFVSVRDPLLGTVSSARPGSTTDLGRAVVAHTLLRDREVVHRRLRRMGIHPLDAEPARIGPDLINRYLEIKRREML